MLVRWKSYFILLLFGWIWPAIVTAQIIVDLKEYGVIPDSKKDATVSIQRAINEAAKHSSSIIRFPKGRIDIYPDSATKKTYYISNATENDSVSRNRTIGMLFKNLSNVTLQGNNTLIVFHGKMMMLAIDHCNNFKVDGLTFDFERPTMSEMTVLSINDTSLKVKINEDSWYRIDNNKRLVWYGEGWEAKNHFLAFYRPVEERMYYGQWKLFGDSKAIELGGRRVQFLGDFSKSGYQAGDVLTIRDPYRDEVGVFNNWSHNVTFQNVRFRYIHGLGILNQLSENISFNKVEFVPDPASGRVISSFADCLHFSNCYGQVRIENNTFSGTHDDPINVHGTFLKIMDISGTKVRLRFMHHQTWGFNLYDEGDSIQFVSHNTLLPYGGRVVVASRLINPREIELEIDRPVEWKFEDGDCVENLTKNPSVLIRNNRLQRVLTRGMLITTPGKVIIENNIFHKTRMYGVLIADDCNSWYESGAVTDVTVRGNIFDGCGYGSPLGSYAIAVDPESKKYADGQYVHKHINIRDNRFVVADSLLVYAKNVEGLTFTNNRMSYSHPLPKPVRKPYIFRLEYCKDVSFSKNKISKKMDNIAVLFSDMCKTSINCKPAKAYQLINAD